VNVNPLRRPRWWVAFSFTLVTAVLFVMSLVGQFVSQMYVLRTDADMHGRSGNWGVFFSQFLAAVFQNWQAEFLSLCWQACGLAVLYHWGSSQSREGLERVERKIDALLTCPNSPADLEEQPDGFPR
jgi:hypothetical protein